MNLLGLLDDLKSGSAGGGRFQSLAHSYLLMLEQFLFSSSAQNRSAPYIRDAASVQGILNNFVIATIPCWLIGLWSLGYQSNLAMLELELTNLPGWRGGILSGWGIGYDPENILACFAHGFLYFLPIFLLALLVSSFWDAIFSVVRRRPLDEGLLAFAWLFVLMLPAGAPLYQVALGMTFGIVMGKHVFGGSGHYLVNPALLAVTFLWLAYPDVVFGESNWLPVPGFEQTSALDLAAAGGIEAVLASGLTWWDSFLGVRPGPIGMTSVLGCLLGALYMIVTGTVSWRVISGVLLGIVATTLVFNFLTGDGKQMFEIPWTWHVVLGGLAFGTVFLATDPVAGAMTNSGRWVFGAFVGLLVIVIRVTNPASSEAILFAVFLASLFSPIIDFVVVELNIRRRKQRSMELTDG
jgi:Na+-transporting NADH:ubiquinone oxidoreductase subunit B